MGNALRFLCAHFYGPSGSGDSDYLLPRSPRSTARPPPHPARRNSASHQEEKRVLQTLPVDARCVGDGDGITVYVSTSNSRESCDIPLEVQKKAVQRTKARAQGDNRRAKELHQEIGEKGYQFITFQNEEVLARKYRIRLRGIDAPEIGMPYGEEAKEELANIVQGKCLTVHVNKKDPYDRLVGDVYCDGIFVQELMLKRGMAWHYTAYDRRPEFAKWERNARTMRVGLWALPNPEKPWEWRRNRREGR